METTVLERMFARGDNGENDINTLVPHTRPLRGKREGWGPTQLLTDKYIDIAICLCPYSK